jgi:hypothetical protein
MPQSGYLGPEVGERRVKDRKDATQSAAATPTGRDGAVDFAVKAAVLTTEAAVLDESDRFARVLGAAAIALWGDLPQPIQEQMFERAVLLGHRGERDEMLREQLAKFLHDHHKRTLANDR